MSRARRPCSALGRCRLDCEFVCSVSESGVAVGAAGAVVVVVVVVAVVVVAAVGPGGPAATLVDRSRPSASYCRPWLQNPGDKVNGSVELQLSTAAAPRGGPSD